MLFFRAGNRREFLVKVALIWFCVQSKTAKSEAARLRLFVERKEVNDDCMRGYLLTQVDGESAPSIACHVLERPALENAPLISAIPAGTYPVTVRTDGARGWRLELSSVPGRNNVQVHLGNYPADTIGCLLLGMDAKPNECFIGSSAEAMRRLKRLFAVFGESGITTLTVRD